MDTGVLVRRLGLCQAIMELASERGIPIAVEEFQTLNRCLDNAIADAVTEFAYQHDSVVAARPALISVADFIDEVKISASLEAQAHECGLTVSVVDATVTSDLYQLPVPLEFEALVARLQANPDFLRFASEARLRDAETRIQPRRQATYPCVLRCLGVGNVSSATFTADFGVFLRAC